MLATALAKMSRNGVSAALARTGAVAAHMSTSAQAAQLEQSVLFESNGATRTYVLNRASKLNALNADMLKLMRPQLEQWSKSDLCKIIVGTGVGRAFCAGGDVATVLQHSLDVATRPKAIEFFKDEFEMDYILSALPKPYVTILDGITVGGGVGLAVGAPFRVATEKSVFAMPETKIGYCPDVGASFFLSKIDGEIGTYLSLTSETLTGREVFELGFATHFVSSRTVPNLLTRLSDLEDPSSAMIDKTIEDHHAKRLPDEPVGKLTGRTRQALDMAFRHNTVEEIVEDLTKLTATSDETVAKWASETLKTLHMRSPTSLKVALEAVRRGKEMTLLEALQMEMGIATAYCSGASTDFSAGITAVLVDKTRGRPTWSPDKLNDVTDLIVRQFFEKDSSYLSAMPILTPPDFLLSGKQNPMRFALPSEDAILQIVKSKARKDPISLSDLLAHFDNLHSRKQGVAEKVVEVVRRRCDVIGNQGSEVVDCKEQ
ncbi:3-hydroxyisobutyryl-coenzyme A hydrolase [Suillus paluster]|uniref:3-hydroxyisobutyryl-coenzyme A hydrolase n=1 Tax=Suillus paluster TaxID=48578 RepID=UPI001B878C0D|nr:3-hydroxyisobutyryl-coenzyme A hydrolase [Suillus paluster]KAG1756342.1 3-hydroxyisobutyryl-coenzyme A hydrolase [Suillus paluster]